MSAALSRSFMDAGLSRFAKIGVLQHPQTNPAGASPHRELCDSEFAEA